MYDGNRPQLVKYRCRQFSDRLVCCDGRHLFPYPRRFCLDPVRSIFPVDTPWNGWGIPRHPKSKRLASDEKTGKAKFLILYFLIRLLFSSGFRVISRVTARLFGKKAIQKTNVTWRSMFGTLNEHNKKIQTIGSAWSGFFCMLFMKGLFAAGHSFHFWKQALHSSMTQVTGVTFPLSPCPADGARSAKRPARSPRREREPAKSWR